MKGLAVGERFQDNSSYQNVPSTCTIADQIHDSEKAGTKDNEKEDHKHIIQKLMLLVKNMEINQTDYANDVRTLCTHLEKHNRGMEIMQNQHAKEIEAMKINHDTEISFMQSKLSNLEENMTTMKANHDREINSMQNKLLTMDEEMTIMTFDHNNQFATMQPNHKEEINSMQHCLMTIKEKDDKVIKDMEANKICLQNKLLTMEEDHAREISAMKVEHSSQMDAIKIQFQKFQQQLEDERNQGTSIDQEPPYLLQQTSSYYEVLCSTEKWIIEGDLDKREINNHIDAHTVNPPAIEDQVITHGTCEIDPSSLAGQMQNEERRVTHILHTSSESFEAESSTSSVTQLARKKKRKRKRTRRSLMHQTVTSSLTFR